MKIVVIQEEIIQTDITPKELTERWKRLEQLPGIDEVVIEVPAHYPNIEQLHTYIGDADAVFGLWIGPDNMNEAFLSQHPNLKYVATLGHGWEKFDTEMTRKRGISISNTIYGSQTIAEYAFALLMDVCIISARMTPGSKRLTGPYRKTTTNSVNRSPDRLNYMTKRSV